MDSRLEEFIRRFVVKQKVIYKRSYREIQDLVLEEFKVVVSRRTLKRWMSRHRSGWDFRSKSRKPHIIHYRLSQDLEEWIVGFRRKTEYEDHKIQHILKDKGVCLSKSTIKRVIAKHSLSRGSKMKGVRLKWVRWQRDTPNSLWQMDHTEEFDKTLRLNVEDDCSRYLLSIRRYPQLTTKHVTRLLDELIQTYGTPRQILTDNGAIYQKQFDKWCRKHGIEHIRSRINKPTTTGKVEKTHDTYNREIHKYRNPEEFRYGYNTQRPHESLDCKTPTEVYNEFHRLLFYTPEKPKPLRG